MLQMLGTFFLAVLCEIGGGYLVWLSLMEGKSLWFGILGGVLIVLYRVFATLKRISSRRVYASYAIILILLSILWIWTTATYTPTASAFITALLMTLCAFIIRFASK